MAASNVAELLQQAEFLAAQLDYEQSAHYYQQALSQTSENPDILEDYSLVLLELGKFEEARSLLMKCVQLSPNEGFSKYMSLGQLANGGESVGFYQKGVELLIRKQGELRQAGQAQEAAELNSPLSSAYISVSEIFMTDCCFEDGAEQKAEKFIQLALNCNPQGYEPLQALANFRICQNRNPEALATLQQSYALWKDAPLGELPPFDFRKATAKLFMELQQNEQALTVVDTLIDEDDDVFDVWYLRGLTNYYTKHFDVAADDFSRAMEIFAKHQLQTDPEQCEIAEQIKQLLKEMAGEASDTMTD